MNNIDVLVSGGGIAGTALAYWLRRHGANPTVVERAGAIRAGGYKVDIRGAALDVVRRMGILDDLRALRTDVRGGSVVDATGRRVASMDGDTFGGRVHGDAEVLRGDLHRILYELTAADVEYRFGDSIAALRDTGDGVEVTFERGDTRRFDLVIGADGVHSRTRELAFADGAAFSAAAAGGAAGAGGVHHLGYYISIFSVPNRLDLDRWELTYVGPGRTALVYSTARQDEAKAMFIFASPPLAYDPADRGAQQRLLAQAYAGEGWEVPALLGDMPAAQDFYFDSLSQVHLDRWSTGRIALTGDAAYCASPASGQGTSLALVGAYVLAGELSRAAHETAGPETAGHETAFAQYERRMRPFVARNQKLGPANVKRMVMRSKGQVRMSMTMLSVLNRLPGKDRLMARMIAPIHRAATAITLDEY
jgi:2-polyprenyl-6-methoxyphenol hydroxylase-like FAD-dependent oxidoreductase